MTNDSKKQNVSNDDTASRKNSTKNKRLVIEMDTFKIFVYRNDCLKVFNFSA